MTVFVDTSALLPLIHRDDADHAAVKRAVGELAARDATLVTSSYTLVECGALVRRRLGVATFRRLGETAAQAMDVVWVDADLHHRGWAMAASGARGGPSLVDCVSFLVMRDLGIEVALALDDHFRRAGFRSVP